MRRYYYKHIRKSHKKAAQVQKSMKLSGLLLTCLGIGMLFYFSMPLMLWNFIFQPALATVTSPLPESFLTTLNKVNAAKKKTVLSAEDDGDKKEWYLLYPVKHTELPSVTFYSITIPKLGIEDAVVATQDTDLSKHLVQYYGTPLPPFKGNTVIFGHSTLPQLFDAKNYTTIFANAHTLSKEDTFSVKIGKKEYNYKIIDTHITTPDDVSVLEQDRTDSFITIITCTPPGTVWKRLIIKAQIMN